MVFLVASTNSLAAIKPESVVPGKTNSEEVVKLLGRPLERIREGASKEYLFYRSGRGSTMDTTISLKKGVVESVTYFCNLSAEDVLQKKSGAKQEKSDPETTKMGRHLTQYTFPQEGKAYVIDTKTKKVKVCVKFETI